MKYIVPALGTVAALALFAFSAQNTTTAIAVERPSPNETFKQLDLFADVLARVRSDYVIDVEDSALIDEALNGMLQSLDPHSSYMNAEQYRAMQVNMSGEYGGLGMEVTTEAGFVKVVAPFDDTPASRAGIKPGDFLTEINGESLIGLSLTEAVEQMRGKPGEPITVTIIRRDEDPMDITMVREIIERKNVTAEVKDGIGYIRIAQFNDKTGESLEAGVAKIRSELGRVIPGIVLDLRRNPGGSLDQSIRVSSAFLNGGDVVSTRGRRPDDVQNYGAEKGELLADVPLVILIDNASASASEIVAGAVQDRGRGLLIGKTSFGKGSVQSIIPLRGGRDGAMKLTTQRYYTPLGRSIQGSGIEPDLFVSATPKGQDDDEFHESDLPNAIQNELDAAEDGNAEPEIKIDYPPEGFDAEAGDYQLQRAIEIIKDGSYITLMAAKG